MKMDQDLEKYFELRFSNLEKNLKKDIDNLEKNLFQIKNEINERLDKQEATVERKMNALDEKLEKRNSQIGAQDVSIAKLQESQKGITAFIGSISGIVASIIVSVVAHFFGG